MQAVRHKAIIVGGGIGGLTAANALLRRANMDVRVVERADDLRKIQVGGSIIVWSNAMRALRLIGLGDAVEAIAMPLERDTFHSWRGRLLGEWPVAQMSRRFGAPTVSLGRGELHRTLYDALPAGTVQLGAQATDVAQDAGGVVVRCADGREERGDVLIGADGATSTVRSLLVGDGPPRYAGYTIWQAPVRTRLGSVGVSQMIFGPGARFVLAKFHPEQAHWFAVMNAPEDAVMDRASLLQRFSGWMDPVLPAIEATEEKAIRPLKVVDRAPVRRWGDGKMTLLGDAAHPMTWDLGQGAGQAIEDALVLSCRLAGNSDLAAGLRAYERRRLPRTALLAFQSRRIGWAASWEHPALCALRDLMFSASWDRGLRRVAENVIIGYRAA